MASYDVNIEELDECYPQAEQPQNIKMRLWPHQLTLLQRCKDFENNKIYLSKFSTLQPNHPNITENDFLRTQVGIIGDHVGSGKSFVILSLIIENDISNMGSTIKSYGNNKVILCFSERSINIKTNLLVIPHNLASQWEGYIKAFSDNIKFLMISKLKHVDFVYENENSIAEYNLIVVTASYYSRIAHFLTSRSFKMQRVIYDEVDNMNLPNCVTIDTNFYWFITASYGNLLYPKGYTKWDYAHNRSIWYANGLRNSGFVKDLFMDLYNNLSKELVKILILKNKDDFVKSSVSLPDMVSNIVKCKTPLTINILDGFVDREIIQSLNAGDIASALQRINPSHRTTEDNLISIQVDRFVREIKNYDIRIESAIMLTYDNEEQRETELTRLRKKKDEIEKRIDGIRERIKTANTCHICFDDICNKTIVPCCSNAYCFLCINIWLSKSKVCPLCKRDICSEELLVVNNNTDEEVNIPIENHNETSETFDKLKNLEIILKNKICSNQHGKILIYSSYDMTFANITIILTKLGIRYAYLKGPIDHIKKTIDRYRNEDVHVLLVNSRMYGSGLNLENTSDVIMFHKVDSEVEKQIIGRAHRFPRQTPLHVHYLLHDNEIRQGVQ